MLRKLWIIIGLFVLPCAAFCATDAPRGPLRRMTLDDRPNVQNVVHRGGNVWMNFTDYGYWGNSGPGQSDAITDPCDPHGWAPQCEFPAGSGQQYLYQGAVWIGALIVEQGFETKRVSTGTDGWLNPSINELWPGGQQGAIVQRSNLPGSTDCFGNQIYDPSATANEEFDMAYSDTLALAPWVQEDPVDGRHRPLGIEVHQTSRAWSSPDFGDFIIVEERIQNIGSSFLKNLYLGLYMDGDVGLWNEFDHHVDDISGFHSVDEATGDTINIPYIADNDARPPTTSSGPLLYPHVMGSYVLMPPGARAKFSYNWWISNAGSDLDYGPAWRDYAADDSMSMSWTATYGTPMGDERKYQLLSNGEIDFDQIMSGSFNQVPPQRYVDPFTGAVGFKSWYDDPHLAQSYREDIGNGYDTRYLLSWGPLGIFDYTDQSGHPVYRLNPGEEFTLTFAFVLGKDFHDANHPQPSNATIDSSLFSFAGLEQTARRAKYIFDRNYQWQPPTPPRNLRPVPTVPGSVTLNWNRPSLGLTLGYQVSGIDPSGTTHLLTTNPITDTVYTTSSLPNGEDWRFAVVTVSDSTWKSKAADTLVRVGAPLPVTGLVAETHGGSVSLNWNANTDPGLSGYLVLRKVEDGDSVSFPAATNAYVDEAVLAGHLYTYWIVAQNNLGLTGFPSAPYGVIPWAPQHRILLIDGTDAATLGDLHAGGVSADSVETMYSRMLTQMGEGFDTLAQPRHVMPIFTFSTLAQYDLVIYHSEQAKLTAPAQEVVTAREEILQNYVRYGGRLLRVGRNLLLGELDYGNSALRNEVLWPMTFDSLYALGRYTQTFPYVRFVGAASSRAGFPEFTLDPAKMSALDWRGHQLDYFPEIDLFYPNASTEVLYRSTVLPTDSSGRGNQPVGVMGDGEIVLGFPLYMLNYDDALAVFRSCVDSLRAFVSGVGPEPEPALPTSILLRQNFPNPFNPRTEIAFDLPKRAHVSLAIYNLLGQQVCSLVNEVREAGSYRVTWNGGDQATGVYICRLEAGGEIQSRKMLLLK